MPELLAHYPFTDTAYHELLDRQGGVRPHWQRLFRQLERSSPEQLRQRQALVERQIQENGVTYNVTPIPRAPTAPGRWTFCRTCCPPPSGSRSPPAWHSVLGCSTRCWPTCTASSVCSPKGCCPANWSSAIRTSSGRRSASDRPAGSSCTAMPWTWRAMPTDAGRSSPTAPRRRPARLCAGEPADRLAGLAGTLSRPARAASRRVFPHPAGDPRQPGRRRRRDAAGGAADSRTFQRNLLRASLPGAPARFSAGRGARPDGARRHPLSQDPRRPETGARGIAAPR